MHARQIALAGTQVSLAEMTEADQTKFCVWLQSEELRSLIDDPRAPGLEDQMQWFQRVQQPDRKFFSLLTVPGGELIGNCGFVDIDAATQEATLRITIGNPDFLGRGLGSEAVSLLVRYGCERMSLKRILLNVLATNARAIRTYEKAGFQRQGEETKNGNTLLIMQFLSSDSL